jgi:hypothetical protein
MAQGWNYQQWNVGIVMHTATSGMNGEKGNTVCHLQDIGYLVMRLCVPFICSDTSDRFQWRYHVKTE